MDRPIYAPGSVPRTLDVLTGEKATLSGIGVLLQAVLGNGTVVDGLAAVPVANSMSLNIGAGSIYSLAAIDSTPYSGLGADARQTIQQGLVWGQTPFNTPAPATAGQSQIYLIEAQFQQVDTNPVALQFYQGSNPTNPLAGYPQNTLRSGVCALQIKAGVPGVSPAAPAPDAGWTPVWAIRVAAGQTSLTAANITPASAAPFVQAKLGASNFIAVGADPNGMMAGTAGIVGQVFPSIAVDIVNGDIWYCSVSGSAATAVWVNVGGNIKWPFYAGTSTGTPNSQTITLPTPIQSFGAGSTFWYTVGAGLTNTGALSLTIPAQGDFPGGTYPVLKDGQTGPVPLTGGEVVAGNAPLMKFDGSVLHLGVPELGTAAMANASSNTGTVAAVQGPVANGDLAAFADSSGTVKRGPAVSSNTGTLVAISGAGTITPGHALVALDVNGTAGDGGPPGAAAAPTYINSSQTVGPGRFLVDTSAGPITLTIVSTIASGTGCEFMDVKGSWGQNNLTVITNGKSLTAPTGAVDPTGPLVCDVSGEDFILWYDGFTLRFY